jgi:hypothetical protein
VTSGYWNATAQDDGTLRTCRDNEKVCRELSGDILEDASNDGPAQNLRV